ncbi:MAG TPA: histidine kinase dimerization/phospho-acceptor domain-containing protein, partial [Methanobacteriaceae archaeon]|nr:histidine kinase dimerization/phospho-acceptor domain-containing protein [Methanobacteriaceae archaeon]
MFSLVTVPMIVSLSSTINELGSLSESYFRLLILIIFVVIIALLAERIEKVRKLHDLNKELAKKAEELKEANEELEAFAYSVSHDLRVPLRAIDGFSRILVEDYEEKLDEEGVRLLNIVRDNTAKMGHLIDDILLLSRAGRQEMRESEIDMKDLAKSVWGGLRPDWEGREVELKIEEMPLTKGDRALLTQVFQNLLSNSLKFTRKKNPAIVEVGAQEG